MEKSKEKTSDNCNEHMLYYKFSSYLKEKFGKKVRKVSVDAGFTCPNRDGTKSSGGCIYCNVDSFSGAEKKGLGEQVSERIMKLRSQGVEKFILYFQSYSNTYADVETIRYRIESSLIDEGIVSVYIGTRPDVIDRVKLAYFAELNKRCEVVLEYGLQSANDNTLKLINRGHSRQEFVDAVELTHEYGIKTCAHIIFGLPGDTREDMLNSVRLCIMLGVKMLKFHHLHIVKKTPLAEMYLKGSINLLSEDEYISVLAEAISIVPEETVISRILGDAANDTLIAPLWGQDKSGFIKKFEQYMIRNNIFQGCASDG